MTDTVVEDIKSRLDIVDIIGNYVTLRQSGTNFKGLCPFHNEKSPSFMANRERQIFRCFGCGEAGDIFAFVMKQENIDFPNALALLASKAGVELPEKFTKGRKSGVEKSALYTVNDLATKFFNHILVQHPAGKEALDYLHKRGVKNELIERFQIGYAPSSNLAIQQLFKKHDFTTDAVRLAGSPERYRDRIMFPFRDVIGQVVGYSGRALHDQVPKYLNTAETDLFRKNRYVYGLFEAKKAIAEAKRVMLVEGQLDLVLAHQAGTAYAVATSGTALTDDHLTILRRYSDTLLLAFDADSAGQKATERAISLALSHGFEINVVVLPAGKDPGEIIATDRSAWDRAVNKPLSAIEWLFGYYFPDISKRPSATERKKIYDALFPYVDKLADVVTRSYALQRLAFSMGVTQEKALVDAFEEWKETPPSSEPSRRISSQPEQEKVGEPNQPAFVSEEARREKSIVGIVLLHPDLLIHKQLHLEEKDFTNEALHHLYTTILSWYNKNTNQSNLSQLISSVETTLSAAARQSLQKLIFDTQTELAELTREQVVGEYTFLVKSVRQKQRDERMQHYADEIRAAEAANDRLRVVQLMQEMQAALKEKELHAKENP
ncbi:MAG TPA: DNA primase [Patescibacteria group bacterium]